MSLYPTQRPFLVTYHICALYHNENVHTWFLLYFSLFSLCAWQLDCLSPILRSYDDLFTDRTAKKTAVHRVWCRDEDPALFSRDPDPAQLEKYYGSGSDLKSKWRNFRCRDKIRYYNTSFMLEFVDSDLYFVQDKNSLMNPLLQVGSGSVEKSTGSGGPKITGSDRIIIRIRILIPGINSILCHESW